MRKCLSKLIQPTMTIPGLLPLFTKLSHIHQTGTMKWQTDHQDSGNLKWKWDRMVTINILQIMIGTECCTRIEVWGMSIILQFREEVRKQILLFLRSEERRVGKEWMSRD